MFSAGTALAGRLAPYGSVGSGSCVPPCAGVPGRACAEAEGTYQLPLVCPAAHPGQGTNVSGTLGAGVLPDAAPATETAAARGCRSCHLAGMARTVVGAPST
jgi:hypothetical protein